MAAQDQLFNHVSPETGFIVPNFPFAHGVCTPARFWIETRIAYGQRIMYQFLDPATKEWFKPKTRAGYVDLCVLELNTIENHPMYGQVIMYEIVLEKLTQEAILSLAHYYEFTDYQRDRILGALYARNWQGTIEWRTTPHVDPSLNTIKKVETWRAKPKTFAAAPKAESLPFRVGGKRVMLHGVDITDMTEEQIDVIRDMNEPC